MPLTLSGSSGVTYPAGGTDNVAGSGVGTSDSQTLTNKTLTTPTIATIKSAASATPTVFQDSGGTEVGTLCRAWVNFNGTLSSPITPRASFNIGSVTKNGTGDFTVNITNALTDANYSVTGTVGGTTNIGFLWLADQATARTTSAFRIYTLQSTTAVADPAQVNLAVFR